MLQSVMEIHSLRQKLAAERDLRYRGFLSSLMSVTELCVSAACAEMDIHTFHARPCVVQVL